MINHFKWDTRHALHGEGFDLSDAVPPPLRSLTSVRQTHITLLPVSSYTDDIPVIYVPTVYPHNIPQSPHSAGFYTAFRREISRTATTLARSCAVKPCRSVLPVSFRTPL